MLHPMTKSTHGFEPSLRRTQSPSSTTTGMMQGDNNDSNPRLAGVESTSEIQALGTRPEPPNSGAMTVTSQVAVGAIKPVDRKTIEGSTPGDHRSPSRDTAKAALDKATDNGGPRQAMGQFANSGRTPTAGDFRSFPGDLADSDAGN